jgi:hypothetical protein
VPTATQTTVFSNLPMVRVLVRQLLVELGSERLHHRIGIGANTRYEFTHNFDTSIQFGMHLVILLLLLLLFFFFFFLDFFSVFSVQKFTVN